ncbi:MAG: hypothetical protein HY289_08415 [Planctomycetes bacterium]|nr:hypothetical protein [Planctomycetota bacterium]
MNALADPRVVEYLNDNFIGTYLKVGTFQIINGQKVGGNVASYFCAWDGGVLHAVPGKINADRLLEEARWAYETRKAAQTFGTNFVKDELDMKKYIELVRRAHLERFNAECNSWSAGGHGKSMRPIPTQFPLQVGQQAQAHWLLARNPMAKLDTIYPAVWTQILREQLSTLPVAKR